MRTEFEVKLKQCEDDKERVTTELNGIKAELIKSVADLATKPKLVIHSALYGAGGARDADVTEQLQKESRNGLAIVVNNDLVPEDPAKFVGTEEERLNKFREIRDQIRQKVQTWVDSQSQAKL